MNSLNILSARVIGQTPPNSPTSHRHRSFSEGNLYKNSPDSQPRRSASQHAKGDSKKVTSEEEAMSINNQANAEKNEDQLRNDVDEKTPLLEATMPISDLSPKYSKARLLARKLVSCFAESLKWVLSTLATPGLYVMGCLYDEKGHFSPLNPVRRLGWIIPQRHGSKSTSQAVGLSGTSGYSEKRKSSFTENLNLKRKPTSKITRRKLQSTESFSSATSDSELDRGNRPRSDDKLLSRTPSTAPMAQPGENNSTARRSIRIKLYNEDTARRQKEREKRGQGAEAGTVETANNSQPAIIAANLKSPTSPVSSSLRMTKYPRALAPPRPLIPRRQPSYSLQPSPLASSKLAQKTLVIDLDETLIHSLAKGGRMSSGHMVEVKLNTTVGLGGATLGPQHPILYYVHKRPHCDDFLRKVCKWYNLVVFTASVQEYADPVIDWLEQERKYFSSRLYRQHCTFRNGAYIKDLSSVEPDLSKVMILDNSPLSYIFHEGTCYLGGLNQFGPN